MRRALAPLAVAALLAAAVAPVGAVHDTGHQFVVRLQTDGDATVFVEDRYDLSNPAERSRFEAIRGNETRQRRLAENVTDRLRRGATLAERASDRSMSVTAAQVNVTTVDGTGVVRVRALWTGLASVHPREDYVQVTEPFASGFAVNRTLVVRGPPGFSRATTHPLPARALKNAAYWGRGADLSGFVARFAGPVQTATPRRTATATVAPVTGAGLSALASAAVLAAVPALLLVLAFLRGPR